MNLSRSGAALLTDATRKLRSIAHELRAPRLRAASASTQERLRELTSALDEFAGSIASSLQSMRSAAAPYMAQAAEVAKPQALAVRDHIAENARALGKLAKRRGIVARHPYLALIAVVGTGYVAVQALRDRPANPASKVRHVPAKRATNAKRSTTKPASRRVRKPAPSRKPAPAIDAARESTADSLH